MREKIAILGGGISGVTLANELSKSGRFEVHLIERLPALGGLQKSVELDGLSYDIGTFVLAGRHEIFASFPWLKDLCLMREFKPQAVRASGRLDRYPISFKGYVADFGYLRTLADLASILPAKVRHFGKKDLPAHIQYYLGRRLYVNSGLKHYIERLYQLEDGQIDIAFATQRLQYLRVFSLRALARAMIRRAVKKFLPGSSAPALDQATYVRPKQGFGALYHEIEKRLLSQGVKVFKGREIGEIRRAGNGFQIDGHPYERIISTIPVPTLAGYMGLPLQTAFECVDLVSLFYRFRGNPGFDSTVLFNYTSAARWKRLTVFSRYYGKAGNGDEYLSVECISAGPAPGDVAWLRRDFEDHVAALGLFRGDFTFQGSEVTHNAYPVFRASEMAKIARAKAEIEALGIALIGRQGAFEFLSSSQAAAGGRSFARTLLGKGER
jgi:protoporphyrinogen oxidase